MPLPSRLTVTSLWSALTRTSPDVSGNDLRTVTMENTVPATSATVTRAARTTTKRRTEPLCLATVRARRVVRLRLTYELDLDLELDLLRHEKPARLEDHVPGQAPVFTVDRRAGAEHRSLVAPGIDELAQELGVQGDLPGDALDRQVSVDATGCAGDVDAGRPEPCRGMVAGIEQVARTEVVVPGLGPRAHRGHLDDDVDHRGGRVIADHDAALDAGEASSYFRQTEVPPDESDQGMARIDRPRAGGRQLRCG